MPETESPERVISGDEPNSSSRARVRDFREASREALEENMDLHKANVKLAMGATKAISVLCKCGRRVVADAPDWNARATYLRLAAEYGNGKPAAAPVAQPDRMVDLGASTDEELAALL